MAEVGLKPPAAACPSAVTSTISDFDARITPDTAEPSGNLETGKDLTSEIDPIIERPTPAPDLSAPPDSPQPPQPSAPRNRKSRALVIVGAAILALWFVVSWIANQVNLGGPGSIVVENSYQPAINPKPDAENGESSTNNGGPSQIASDVEVSPLIAPSPPPPVNLAGEWFDELSGTGVAQARVVIQQNNNTVSGTFFNSEGLQAGTVSGEVNGNNLFYNYYSPLGSGIGYGALDADGAHLRILVNNMESHILHRSHLPGK